MRVFDRNAIAIKRETSQLRQSAAEIVHLAKGSEQIATNIQLGDLLTHLRNGIDPRVICSVTNAHPVQDYDEDATQLRLATSELVKAYFLRLLGREVDDFLIRGTGLRYVLLP